VINLKSKLAKREWAARADRMMRTVEGPMARRLAAEFDRVARESGGAGVVDIHHHANNLRLILLNAYETTISMFLDVYFSTKKTCCIVLEYKLDTEDEIRRRAVKLARARAQQIADDIAKTTKDKIRRAITTGLGSGKTTAQIAKDILLRVGGSIAKRRAMTIARTEVHGAANGALLEGAHADADVLENKEWVATEDDRTRVDHDHANGQIVGIKEMFTVGGEKLRFPGDPSGSPENIINCRCQIVFGS